MICSLGQRGAQEINRLQHRNGDWGAHAAGLLFPAGKRPTIAALRSWSEARSSFTISHVPPDTHQRDEICWAELLLDGMTFDIEGMAPGRALDPPAGEFHFDAPVDAHDPLAESLLLRPGPHISGGARSLPVIRSKLRLLCLIAEQASDLSAIFWGPARSMIGRQYFLRVTRAWLDGGPFPALGLTAFKPTIDDGLQSEGLAYFTGQELRIEPELAHDKVEATRLAARLVNQLVPLGRLDGPEIVTAPDGRTLCLAPSANGRYVRVREG